MKRKTGCCDQLQVKLEFICTVQTADDTRAYELNQHPWAACSDVAGEQRRWRDAAARIEQQKAPTHRQRHVCCTFIKCPTVHDGIKRSLLMSRICRMVPVPWVLLRLVSAQHAECCAGVQGRNMARHALSRAAFYGERLRPTVHVNAGISADLSQWGRRT